MIPPNWAQHLQESFPDHWVHKAVLSFIRRIHHPHVSHGEEMLARKCGTYLVQPDPRVEDCYLVCAETGKGIRWGNYGWVKMEAQIYGFPILREIRL